jgi:hypothetical protein
MSSFEVPSAEAIATMSPAQREATVRELDAIRRQAEAAIGLFVGRVEQVSGHIDDGHRSVSAWGRAATNWSGAEASRFTRLGRVFRTMPIFEQTAVGGGIGVAQMHALAAVAANPRVKDHLAGSEALLVEQARTQHHDDYLTILRRWEALADPDGAFRAHERVHERRNARLSISGDTMWLDAHGGTMQGTLMRQIFDRFKKAQWLAEWEAGQARHGNQMRPDLLDRTEPQRRFDTLLAIFRAAAGSGEMAGDPVVNMLIDQEQFEHQLAKLAGHDPEPIDPATVLHHRNENAYGDQLHPAHIVAAALVGHVRRVVLDGRGVLVNLGRRKRLFTGPLREAILFLQQRCTHPGCTLPGIHCEADHTLPFAHAGPTNADNAGTECRHHNHWKNLGFTTVLDPQGRWHTYRPDGTEIGWPVQYLTLAA